MKLSRAVFASGLKLAGLLMLLTAAGCATNRDLIVQEPVGPTPHGSFVSGEFSEGCLVVYTPVDGLGGSYDYSPPRTGYQLAASCGEALRRVQNEGELRGVPEKVVLPPGEYSLTAKASDGYTDIRVPVVIQSGRTTTVHLDGATPGWMNRQNKESLVVLPDGEAIGFALSAVGSSDPDY